jgi:bifunctional DNA-binding transcriptional regulator/antitoxin component of YhaV-PrlF toxin-antitoxin module
MVILIKSMKKEKVELIGRIGPKGQIVIRKELRKALGLKPGALIKQKVVDRKILLEVVKKEEKLERIKALAKKIGKAWPKGITAVEAVRMERR